MKNEAGVLIVMGIIRILSMADISEVDTLLDDKHVAIQVSWMFVLKESLAK